MLVSMKKVNEVRVYVRPEVEEIDLALSSVLCQSGGGADITGEGSNEAEDF